MDTHTAVARAGNGPHHLILGDVVASRVFGGDGTGGQLSLLELRGLPRSGPGRHIDPWRETIYVLDGELSFQVDEEGDIRDYILGPGDAISVPAGVGHSFSVIGPDPGRYLIVGTAAGLDRFFADAGERVEHGILPSEAQPFDRDRLRAAFTKHAKPPANVSHGTPEVAR